MSFTEAVGSVFRNYANFSGRARRSEYWWFILFNFLAVLVFGVLTAVTRDSAVVRGLYGLYSLGVILPSLAVSWRRMHDIGRSGLWALFPAALSVTETVLIMVGAMTAWTTRNAVAGALVIAVAVLGLAALVWAVVYIIWLARPGQEGPNRYGPDPKNPDAAEPGGERPPWEY